MPVISKRKLIKIGDSIGITIPKDFLDTYSLKRGDVVKIVSDPHDEVALLLVDLNDRTNEEILRMLKIYN